MPEVSMSRSEVWYKRNLPLGAALFAVFVLSFGSALGAALAHGAQVEVSPAQALPGASVTVMGTGFEAGTIVTVSLESASGVTTLGTAVADKDENFTLQVTIPASAAAGSYTLKASAGDDKATAEIMLMAPSAGDAKPAATEAGSVVHKRTAIDDVLIGIGFGLLAIIGLVLVLTSRPRWAGRGSPPSSGEATATEGGRQPART